MQHGQDTIGVVTIFMNQMYIDMWHVDTYEAVLLLHVVAGLHV